MSATPIRNPRVEVDGRQQIGAEMDPRAGLTGAGGLRVLHPSDRPEGRCQQDSDSPVCPLAPTSASKQAPFVNGRLLTEPSDVIPSDCLAPDS